MIISEKIQAYRKRAGLSQEELAKSLLVSRQTISLWENGQTLPTIDNLIRLKEIFGVSLDEMLSEDDMGSTNTEAELFEESYSAESADIGKIKRAFLYPRYAICGTLILLVSSLIAYTVLKNPVGFIGISLPILIAILLTALALTVASAIATHREIRIIESGSDKRKTTVRINPETVVIETKQDGKTVSYHRSEYAEINVSRSQCETVAVRTASTAVYLNANDISSSAFFPLFKKARFTAIHALYVTAAVALSLILTMRT